MLSFLHGNSPEEPLNAFAFVLAGLARLAHSCETLDDNIRKRLQTVAARCLSEETSLPEAFAAYMKRPHKVDGPLLKTARKFHLETVETLAVRLAIAAEQDLLTGHLLASLQQPLARSRPTIGLLAQAFAPDDPPRAVQLLGQGNAIRCGLLELCGEENPLPERQVRVPLATALAIEGQESSWPGTSTIARDQAAIPLGQTADTRAAAIARRLRASGAIAPALVIRCGETIAARAAAAKVAALARATPILIQTEQLAGMAPWLALTGSIPVFSHWLAPGELKSVPSIPLHAGPIVLLAGPEGDFTSDDRGLLEWKIETPPVAERAELWTAAIGEPALAHRLAADHRHSAGRIALLSAKAREEWALSNEGGNEATITFAHIRAVSRRGDATGLDALAELIPDEVGDDALVVTGALRLELESLVARCRLREQFTNSLGPSILARYRPSVRALFVGPSGTGKTLAVSWLASRLGLPLFRVDLAAVTSKYIGETEKNLSQLLARAEQNEVLLLFDEADSLFGKRTDIHEANDRFANAQTNYLLQRMESYDGITVLTSNGRSRFDDAFSRRFDAILTFPLPDPEVRRRLWQAHLGARHSVPSAQLNLLSAVVELTGGQIRNAVLRAAVDAASLKRDIDCSDLINGVAAEYRKLNRQLPNDLRLIQSEAGGTRLR
ncbi:MAG: ATP-binding protein [Terracidiphilus sp.]|jgi:hypothetical protein